MSVNYDQIETITVDSYGTLVDPNSIHTKLAEYVDTPREVSYTWFSRALLNKLVGNFIDVYKPFDILSADGLEYSLQYHDISLSDEEKNEILSLYDRLEVYDGVKQGIERIKNAGYDIYVVSNGTPDMLERLIEHARVADLVSDTISADEIEVYKPDERIYQHTSARTGTPINKILHVSGPYFDVLGAMHAGMQGCWINYGGGPRETFAGSPHLEVSSVSELADTLSENST